MKMLSVLMFVLILSLGSSCVSVRGKTPEGLEIEYERMGNQSIGLFEIKPDGTTRFEQQKSEHETLYQALNKLVDKIPTP